MTTIYLVRHGEADYEQIRERRWPGAMADLAPLTARGYQQAVAAAEQLAAVSAVRLISSPFTRTMHTATVIGCRVNLPVEVEVDLHEWLPDNTFSWQEHAEVRAFHADFESCGGEWPDGDRRAWEPLSCVRLRSSAALRRAVVSIGDNGSLIAVCHEMVIRSVTGELATHPGEFRRLDSTELP
jgi:broad specificity phosphatase PhoE